MFRPIATVFIVAVAVQVTFAFIDHPRETIILKLSDKDVIKANSVSKYKTFPLNAKRCSLDEDKTARKYLDTKYNSTKMLIFLLYVFYELRLKRISLLLIVHFLLYLTNSNSG
jgi:hypothetical protein